MEKMTDADCPLCGDREDVTVLYEQNFKPSDLNKDTFSARRLPDRLHYRVVRCNRDGLVRSSPVLAQERLANLYKESRFTYHEETDPLARTYLRAIEPALAAIGKKGRILEVGCGNGFVLEKLRLAGYENVCGLEPSRDAVESADVSVKPCIANDMLREGLFEPGSFDLIVFFQVLDHIPDPNSFLQVCFAWLRPGGRVVAFHHDVAGWSHRLLHERCPIVDVEHTHLYDARTCRAIFVKNGFDVLNVSHPANLVSLRHLIWLSPVPAGLKQKLLTSRSAFLRKVLALTCWLKLGNLCLDATRE